MSFQKVVKPLNILGIPFTGFRTVSFQKVVKRFTAESVMQSCFRTVSFQKVVKLGSFMYK